MWLPLVQSDPICLICNVSYGLLMTTRPKNNVPLESKNKTNLMHGERSLGCGQHMNNGVQQIVYSRRKATIAR